MKIRIKYQDESITRISRIKNGDWIDLRASEDIEVNYPTQASSSNGRYGWGL